MLAGVAVVNAQTYWWLAPLISLLALLAIIWFQWGQHKVRACRLRTPFKAYLTYGPDVRNEDEQTTLRLPANSQVYVQIRIRPVVHYKQLEIVFGCEGDRTIRPVPLRVFNRFIKIGLNREQDPTKNSNNYIDNDDHYHIVAMMDRSPGNTQALEFVVKTKKPGNFPILLQVITDAGEAKPKNNLSLTVVAGPVPSAHKAKRPPRT